MSENLSQRFDQFQVVCYLDALNDFTEHTDPCPQVPSSGCTVLPCSCGLDALRKQIEITFAQPADTEEK